MFGRAKSASGVKGGRVRGGLASIHGQLRRIATAGAAVLVVALGYHVVFGQNGLTVYQAKRVEALSLEEQVRTLAEENDRLKEHVERLETDPASIEHQAREELHYTRPGEVIVTLPNEKPASSIKVESDSQ